MALQSDTTSTTDRLIAMWSLFFGKSAATKNNDNEIVLTLAKREKEITDQSAQLTAMNRSVAVIEFDVDGKILTANQNFLDTMGYALQDIQGNHHRMFVGEKTANSVEYQRFWRSLRDGEFLGGEYLRFGKGGRGVWIQASYNPTFDANGRFSRVIKFASDITAAHESRQQVSVVSNSISDSVSQFSQTITEISSNVNRTASLSAEAKEIAISTCDATKNIESSVRDIQQNITGVVTSTETISKSVSEVSVNMTTIAAAVEEQSVTMSSISRTADELRAIRMNVGH